MWLSIANEFDDKTWKQCEDRYKTVMKRKRAAVNNNNTSGSKRQCTNFDEELEKIAKLDDSIEPAIQISSQAFIQKEHSDQNQKSVRNSDKGIINKKSIQQTLIDIAEQKEKARAIRHKERMERADRIENLLKQLIKPDSNN